MLYPTIDELRQRCLQWDVNANGERTVSGSIYNRRFLRPISIRLTFVCVRWGISADTATWLMTFAGIVGVAGCVPHGILWTFVGAIGLFLFDLLDAVDGEIARWHGTSSTRGLFLDQMSHMLVGFPSLGIAALHAHVITQQTLYLYLALAAMVSGATGRALRESFQRINAEAGVSHSKKVDIADRQTRPGTISSFIRLCRRLRVLGWTAFPFTKARIVHLLTLIAIFMSYFDVVMALQVLAWFYAVYGVIRLAFEIPYFYLQRVTNRPHVKEVSEYRWPI